MHTVIDALITRELAAWFPPDWQVALASGEVLFNHPTPPPAPSPQGLPSTIDLPRGFTDFDHDEPLDGALQPTEITDAGGTVTLAAANRRFALAPVGGGEYRFAGWSEQRTLQLTASDVLLRARHGRAIAERRLPASTSAAQ